MVCAEGNYIEQKLTWSGWERSLLNYHLAVPTSPQNILPRISGRVTRLRRRGPQNGQLI